jgi:Phage virion morphogenesis family
MISFKLEGNFDEIKQRIDSLKSIIEEELQAAFDEAGAKAVELLKGHIEQQDLGWRPLSEAYLLSKAKEGYAQEILQRTKKMYESITYNAGEGGFWAGIPDGAQSDTGESISMIAAVHEFGADSVGIEARPLYGPTVQELKEWMKKDWQFEDRILRRLK